MKPKSWALDDPVFAKIWSEVEEFTMTSPERGYALYQAVLNVLDNRISGSFVECGVWRGGSTMLMLKTLLTRGNTWRRIVIFDTFDGMTPPSDVDFDRQGRSGQEMMEADVERRSDVWAVATEDEVRRNIESCGYPLENIRFVPGDVRETLSKTETNEIAILRLDTDFYDSTRAELEQLYPRLNTHGIMIVDDYGHWNGARQAVDEYLSKFPSSERRPLPVAVDYTGRVFVKTSPLNQTTIERYDYTAPGLENPGLLPHFPNLTPRDPKAAIWRYLRYRCPHLWRVDTGEKARAAVGTLSVDEAVLLYNLAKPFSGHAGLEVGAHVGWSTAHIAAAGVRLDTVDPFFSNTRHFKGVRERLAPWEENPGIRYWAGFSPSILDAVAASRGAPWSFIFIDGDHDGDAPRLDALAASQFAADDAIIVFHDLTSPHVADGLKALQDDGWDVQIFDTMQIVGVAYRGAVELPTHQSDPNLMVARPNHLSAF
ncbi:MAG: TylF/MycF/NovP-related O-methyltransferase [Pseudomonadota bacterium]